MRYGNPSKKAKTIASLKGHAVEFPGKGSVAKSDVVPPHPKFPERAMLVSDDGVVYVYVPQALHEEVIAAGMLPESEIEEKDDRAGPRKPEDKAALEEQLFDTFRILVAAGERESFAGTGVPKVQAVEKLLGYDVTKADVGDAWTKFQQMPKE